MCKIKHNHTLFPSKQATLIDPDYQQQVEKVGISQVFCLYVAQEFNHQNLYFEINQKLYRLSVKKGRFE
jgi:hypothetical protein